MRFQLEFDSALRDVCSVRVLFHSSHLGSRHGWVDVLASGHAGTALQGDGTACNQGRQMQASS